MTEQYSIPEKVASALHGVWRLPRLQPDGSYEICPKSTNDTTWVQSHGTDEIDIANTDFVDLPTDWQAENLLAAGTVLQILGKSRDFVELGDQSERTRIGRLIHNEWLRRNGGARKGELDVPFDRLPEHEQQKDIRQMRVGQQVASYWPGIVSGFPGIGKTHLAEQNPGAVLDSDYSVFSRRVDTNGMETKNPEFPRNYMERVVDTLGEGAITLVSTHRPVRKALADCSLHYLLVYPDRSAEAMDEYMRRFETRGDTDDFVDYMRDNWHGFIDECEAQEGPVHVRLHKGQHLDDVPAVTSYIAQY